MTFKHAQPIILLFATCAYLGFVALGDFTSNSINLIGTATSLIPILLLATFLSFCVRYWRWRALLMKTGAVFPLLRGFYAYLAGFAYTATPGKAGELIRIRYFNRFSVESDQTFGAFVFERGCDLIAVLLLSLFILDVSAHSLTALIFVGIIIVGVVGFVSSPRACLKIASAVERYSLTIAGLFKWLEKAGSTIKVWLTPKSLAFNITLGILAWSILSLSFVYLQYQFSNGIEVHHAFSIYPLAMLIGAASMLPGGIGTTEAAIILLLKGFGFPTDAAIIVALTIRLSTLWFAIALGFLAMLALETIWPPKTDVSVEPKT